MVNALLSRIRLQHWLPQGTFARHVLTLMTGTAIAQAVPIAISPILTRLYTPEDFGIVALYMAIATTLSVIATGRYELAIMLPRKKSDAANIAAFSIVLNLIISSFLLLVVWLFNAPLTRLLGNPAIANWLYFIPLTVCLTGLYVNLNYWSNRQELYRVMANRRVVQSVATGGGQLGLGLVLNGASGLVLGGMGGQAVAVAMMGQAVVKNEPGILRGVRQTTMLALAKRYRNFPMLMVPAHVLNTLSSQLPVVLLNTLFGLATSGFFSLTQRVIGLPMSLIANAIGDVFRQQASQAFILRGHCGPEFDATFKRLLLLGLPIFGAFYMLAPFLFSVVFGEQWRIAGDYARLLTPMFFMQFISTPLGSVFIITQRQKLDLAGQMALFLLTNIGLLSGYALFGNAHDAIALFSAAYSFMYLVALLIARRLSVQGVPQPASDHDA